jgi:hypothetical protein
MFERIDEDSLKTNLHLKVTAIQNVKNLISDTIIRFAYFLSDHEVYLEHTVRSFLEPVMEMYHKRYIDSLEGKRELTVEDIEKLRMVTKILIELFPNVHKCSKEELMRLKVYHYCLMVQGKVSIFDHCANIIDLVTKHDINATDELRDTVENREIVIKSIFVKLIVHKLRAFFGTIVSYYEDLRRMPTPRTIKTAVGQR